MAYNWNPFDPANDMWGTGTPIPTPTYDYESVVNRPASMPDPTLSYYSTRPQGGTTPSGNTLGVQQNPYTAYSPTPFSSYGSNYGLNNTNNGTSDTPEMTEGQYRYWLTRQGQNTTTSNRTSNYPADTRNYMAEAQLAAQVERERIAAENARAANQLAWYQQQQAADLEAQKQQRLATLAAQPKSWLEYAALANQQPIIQPWMLPLMPRQYSNLQAGQPIPGWAADNMQGMPDLSRPSAQYMARLSPTAQAQYYGYQQADTGATDESMYWLNQSTAPAGSPYKELSYQR